eukprot:11166455-Lingulodinium_polyedra.AAC.1
MAHWWLTGGALVTHWWLTRWLTDGSLVAHWWWLTSGSTAAQRRLNCVALVAQWRRNGNDGSTAAQRCKARPR